MFESATQQLISGHDSWEIGSILFFMHYLNVRTEEADNSNTIMKLVLMIWICSSLLFCRSVKHGLSFLLVLLDHVPFFDVPLCIFRMKGAQGV